MYMILSLRVTYLSTWSSLIHDAVGNNIVVRQVPLICNNRALFCKVSYQAVARGKLSISAVKGAKFKPNSSYGQTPYAKNNHGIGTEGYEGQDAIGSFHIQPIKPRLPDNDRAPGRQLHPNLESARRGMDWGGGWTAS